MKTNNGVGAAKTALVLAVCFATAAFGAIGCQKTAEGAATDAKNDTAAVGNAADKAAQDSKMAADNAAKATADAGKNAGDALTLTPKVKTAIIADATLNNPKNEINVDTKDGVVHLKGHVLTNDMKKLATTIAQKTITESGSKDKFINQLTVEAH